MNTTLQVPKISEQDGRGTMHFNVKEKKRNLTKVKYYSIHNGPNNQDRQRKNDSRIKWN